MMREALGLIEVIGYTPAVVAADAALKAANVRLAGITKVDGGIMTVQIFGDVGAIISAVEAGGMAASKVGSLRATHVIPSVDPSLFGTVIKGKIITKILESESETIKQDNTTVIEASTQKGVQDIKDESLLQGINELEASISEPTKVAQKEQGTEPITIEELQKKSNMQLKMLITSLGIKVAPEKLKSAKKQDLIRIITDFYKK